MFVKNLVRDTLETGDYKTTLYASDMPEGIFCARLVTGQDTAKTTLIHLASGIDDFPQPKPYTINYEDKKIRLVIDGRQTASQVNIYNSAGSLAGSFTMIDGRSYEFNAGSLSAGMYIISFNIGKHPYRQKIIIYYTR